MVLLANGSTEQSRGIVRVIFWATGIIFCCIWMVYFVSLKETVLVLGNIGPISLPNIYNDDTTRNTVVGNNTTGFIAPTKPYDLTTYGLKLFKCNSKNPLTSATYSKLYLSYESGNMFVILVNMYDNKNSRRNTGGDVIVMWAEQHGGDGRVSGSVTDNLNGSYTGSFKIFWTGRTVIRVKLVSTIQNQCLRSNALYRYGNTVYAKQIGLGIQAVFQKGRKKCITKCGANSYIHLSPNLCNFTKLNANVPWFCGSPPTNSHLKCLNVHHFTTGHFSTAMIPSNEKIRDIGHGVLGSNVEIYVKKKWNHDTSVQCCKVPAEYTWTNTKPSGYWAGGRWNSIQCDNSGMSFTYESYRNCLRGKHLVMIGDSTVRQIIEFFLKNILQLGHIDLKNGKELGTLPQTVFQMRKEFNAFGITATYLKHEFPFHNNFFPTKNITSIPQELQRLESENISGKDLIVLLHYNLHLQAFPIEEFRLRIRRLVPAIQNLLRHKTGTKVLFKGPHMAIDDGRWFDPRISLIYMDIIHKEFWEIRNHVIYLDTWSITVAHNSEHFHPHGAAFNSQIQLMMSYICPYKNM